jgi:hypothetical protein
MHRFVHAAVFAVAISAPVLGGALMDQSVVSVLGKPAGTGPCSSSCTVGGAQSGSPAAGGYVNTGAGGPVSGTLPVGTSSTAASAGRTSDNPPGDNSSTASGNFNTIPIKGHCTGANAKIFCS